MKTSYSYTLEPLSCNQVLRYKLLILLILILVSGCLTTSQSRDLRDDLQGMAIVYQTELEELPAIGFTNDEGDQGSIITLDGRWHKPFWTDDDIFVAILPADHFTFGYVEEMYGDIAVDSEAYGYDILSGCEQEWVFEVMNVFGDPEDLSALVIIGAKWLTTVDLADCELGAIYVDATGENITIGGASISPDLSWIVYAEVDYSDFSDVEHTLVLSDITTGESMELIRGVNPAISPDGQWISYVYSDGINVIREDGSEDRIVVDIPLMITTPGQLQRFQDGLPYPRWSPDSQWLIFHRPPNRLSYSIDQASIYIVNIYTSEIVHLVDDGVYPFWKGGR